MNRPFVVSLISAVIVGGLLGAVFLGGVSYGKGLTNATSELSASALSTSPRGQVAGSGETSQQDQLANFRATAIADRMDAGSKGLGRFAGQGLFPVSRGVAGTIEKVEDGVITVASPQGTVRVIVGSATTYQKVATSAGTTGDLRPGATVQVTGQRAEDGTVTARMIVITSGELTALLRTGQGRPGGSQAQTGN